MDTSRIEKFLAGLADSALSGSQQAMIFTCDENVYGEINSKTCENGDASACAENTGICHNAGVCGNSSNSHECKNGGIVATNSGVIGGCLKPSPDNGDMCQVLVVNGWFC